MTKTVAAFRQDSTDYERIERSIRFLAENATRNPDLEEIAAHAELSAAHFQRLFTRWAGISPKKLLQFLALGRARGFLGGGSTVLDAAYDAGLSGPGRLHDLVVTTEAVTPGELRSRGRGLSIRYGFHPTPFGECLIGLSPRGLCHLSFVTDGRNAALSELHDRWTEAKLSHDQTATRAAAQRIFATRRTPGRPLALFLRGTNFQLKVWEALLRIPEGRVASYLEVARGIGRPSAARAVASAVARNPVAFLIPCHRVLRSVGSLGGYHWGVDRKRAMLAWEASRADSTKPADSRTA